jgi:hypothetical protein
MALSEYVRTNNYTEVAKLFAQSAPEGNVALAVEFLERVIGTLDGGSSHKKTRIDTYSEGAPVVMKDIDTSFIIDDAIDDNMVTLALQIPEDMNLIAFIIGPKGINVIQIGKTSGTKVQIEKVGQRGADQYRHVFLMGPLKGVLHAYQLLQEHMATKVGISPVGSTSITKVVVPDCVVAHIIGRGWFMIMVRVRVRVRVSVSIVVTLLIGRFSS